MGNVEIKLNFGAAQIENAKGVFGLDGEPEQREIWFGEIIDGLAGRDALPLLERGVILRLRDKRKSDATLKLRAPDGAINAAAWKERTNDLGKAAKLEGDWAGDKRMISASLSGDLDAAAVDELRSNHPSVAKLLSAAQQAVATDLMVPFERAVLLGPVAALKWEAADAVEAEQWVRAATCASSRSRSSRRTTRSAPWIALSSARRTEALRSTIPTRSPRPRGCSRNSPAAGSRLLPRSRRAPIAANRTYVNTIEWRGPDGAPAITVATRLDARP
jgi:hypothetical protein